MHTCMLKLVYLYSELLYLSSNYAANIRGIRNMDVTYLKNINRTVNIYKTSEPMQKA